MLKPLRISCLCISMLSLSACMLDGTQGGPYYWDAMPSSDPNQLYPESYDTTVFNQPADRGAGTKTVVVPQSYHVGSSSPVASKDEDRQWVDNQNPGGYTIEVAKDAKPAAVANKLYKAPKTERTAEVRSQSGSYLGLYGSYPSREQAEQQLNALPDEVKQQATIKNWQSIQNEIN